MSNNRRAVVVRLNDQEYEVLEQLTKFWSRPHKDVMKLALVMLGRTSFELQEKLAAQQPEDKKPWESDLPLSSPLEPSAAPAETTNQ